MVGALLCFGGFFFLCGLLSCWDADPFGGGIPQPGVLQSGVSEGAVIASRRGWGRLWVWRLPSYLIDGVSGDEVI